MWKMNSQELTKIIDEVVPDDDKNLVELIFTLVTKIDSMHSGEKISIAKLIDYNPRQSYVEPLTQGKVNYYLRRVCERIGIQLVDTDDDIGGMAYYYTYKIVK